MAEDRTSEPKGVSAETSQTEKQIEKRKGKNANRISRNRGATTECAACMKWDYQKKKGERTDEIFDAMMTVGFAQINVRHPTIDPGRSESSK